MPTQAEYDNLKTLYDLYKEKLALVEWYRKQPQESLTEPQAKAAELDYNEIKKKYEDAKRAYEAYSSGNPTTAAAGAAAGGSVNPAIGEAGGAAASGSTTGGAAGTGANPLVDPKDPAFAAGSGTGTQENPLPQYGPEEKPANWPSTTGTLPSTRTPTSGYPNNNPYIPYQGGGYTPEGGGMPSGGGSYGAGLGGAVTGGGMLGGGGGFGSIPLGGAISAPIGRDPNSPYSGGIGGDGLYGGNQATWDKYYADLYAKNHAADPVSTPATGITSLGNYPDRNGTLTTWDQLAAEKAARDAAAAGGGAGTGQPQTFQDLLNSVQPTSTGGGTSGGFTWQDYLNALGAGGSTNSGASGGGATTGGTGTPTTGGSTTGSGAGGSGTGQGSPTGSTPTTGGTTSTSNLPAWAQQLMDEYNAANVTARNANEARYQDGLRGYAQLIADSKAAVSDKIGASRRNEIDEAYAMNRGRAEQDLINRGLGNTTVRPTVLRGIDSQKQRDLTDLEDAQARLDLEYSGKYEKDRLDYMERRTDTPPDLQGMVALFEALGKSGTGAATTGSTTPTSGTTTPTSGSTTPATTGSTTPATTGTSGGSTTPQPVPTQTQQQANAHAIESAYLAQNTPKPVATGSTSTTAGNAPATGNSTGYPTANVPGYTPVFPTTGGTSGSTTSGQTAAATPAPKPFVSPYTGSMQAGGYAGIPNAQAPSLGLQIAAGSSPYTPPTISNAAYQPTSTPQTAANNPYTSGDARTSTGTRSSTPAAAPATSPLGYSTVQNPGAADVGTQRITQASAPAPLSAYAQALKSNMTGSYLPVSAPVKNVTPVPGMPGSSVIWPASRTTTPTVANPYLASQPAAAAPKNPLDALVANPYLPGSTVTRKQSMLM